MTDVFQFEEPLARWKREADERTAAEQEERRNRGRAERRAPARHNKAGMPISAASSPRSTNS